MPTIGDKAMISQPHHVARFAVRAGALLFLALTSIAANAQEPAADTTAGPSAAIPSEPRPASATVNGLHIAPPAASPLRIEGANGTSIRLGLLVQPQFQAVSHPVLDGYAKNLYVRRTRIIVGGTLFDRVEYFLDTDYPNLFLDNNTAPAGAPANFVKNTPGLNIQDVFVTYKAIGDMLKIDVGYMLPPLAHNAVQGATTLYGWDYFGYTFQHTAAFGSSGNPFGRDTGIQLRGLVLGGLLEYRVGVFQGLRDNRTTTEMEARNFFRLSARLQINLLDPEPGFFYAGTYLGAKRIASVGASFDFQDSYKYFAVDGFVDLPAGPGLVTAQVNLAHWNGDTFIPNLVKETALMGEAGYTLAGVGLGPIVRVERLWGSGNLADQTRFGGGVAYWPYGHNSNFKLFYTRIKDDGAREGADQFNLQWQVYFF
jgi:hypothetical protein